MTHVDPGGEVHGHGVAAASAAVHHEVTDIPLGGLTRAAVIATVFVGLVMVLMWGAWGFFLSQAKQGDPGKPAMAADDFGQRLPATPRLQSVPGNDLAVLPGRAGRQARRPGLGRSGRRHRADADQRGHAADRHPRRRLRRSEGQGARGSLVGVPGRRDDGQRRRAGRAAAARAHAVAGAGARHRARRSRRPRRSTRTDANCRADDRRAPDLRPDGGGAGIHAPRSQPAVERSAGDPEERRRRGAPERAAAARSHVPRRDRADREGARPAARGPAGDPRAGLLRVPDAVHAGAEQPLHRARRRLAQSRQGLRGRRRQLRPEGAVRPGARQEGRLHGEVQAAGHRGGVPLPDRRPDVDRAAARHASATSTSTTRPSISTRTRR